MTIPKAVEIFVQAFSQEKSRTYPYVPTQLEPWLWVMQDTPDRKKARKREVISISGDPAQTVNRIEEAGFGWHFICEIHPPDVDFESIRSEYKRLGYRAISTEWLYVHRLDTLPDRTQKIEIVKIESEEIMATIPQTASQKRKLMEGTTKFAIHDGNQDLGWVTHIPMLGSNWVSSLWVRPEYRSKGMGRALMTELLHHAKTRGDAASVLLASSDGARLYPKVGYELIAVLQMFCPAKR
ncbi:MAG: GNAT family N-acetyltransferase [Armatimonadota bacterium]